MSRMSSFDMTKRLPAKAVAAPAKPSATSPKATTVKLPKKGEVHIRPLKDGGHVATVRDSNYNTVSETFLPQTGQLRLE